MAKPIPQDMIQGTIHQSKTSGNFEIKSYLNSRNILVRFIDTGYEVTSNIGNIRRKNVKDPLFKSILGVGFVGVGDYPAVVSRSYDAWRCMITRCYSKKFHDIEPSYIGCSVCDEWHNYQNFAKWHEENYPKDGRRYALDKDLLVIGNKVYSPETCMYVTQEVNAVTTDMNRSRGDMMIGVDFVKRTGLFRARCSHGSNSVSLGYFGDEKSAHEAWRLSKSRYLIELSLKQNNKTVADALVKYATSIVECDIYRDGYVK